MKKSDESAISPSVSALGRIRPFVTCAVNDRNWRESDHRANSLMVGGQRSICSAILRLGRFMQPAPSNLPVMVRLSSDASWQFLPN